MSILPRRERLLQRVLKSIEVVERTASLVVISANGRFGEIKMAVTARVIASAEKFLVLFVRERLDVQSVRGAETHLHSEENILLRPHFGEKIVAFVESHAMNRQCRANPLAKINSQTLGCHWTVF